ncbi:MAG: 16S rRNA (adenine(1518)-N(6)/adenine(1519)-N(6))-dimethyltransferase RsmA [Lentihominibacter sp.]
MELYSPSTIKDIRNRHNFKLSKSLGQNFITDRNVLEQIIEGAGIGPKDLVIEIGPGIGVLTAEAAERAARVVAVEIDEKLIPILNETLGEFDNVRILNRDILKTDLKEIIREEEGAFTGEVRIIGNLPYYITTPIVMKLLEEAVPAASITIMMQKEVADRIRSGPGTKSYGAISVGVQYYCDVNMVASVPRDVFIPQPKVDSTVLNLVPLKEKRIQAADEKVFFFCVKAAFAQRRKTLLNSLSSAGGMEKDAVRKILEKAGIDPGRRAETLTMEEFGRLADEVVNEKAERDF